MKIAAALVALLSLARHASGQTSTDLATAHAICQSIVQTCAGTGNVEQCVRQAYASGWSNCQVIEQKWQAAGQPQSQSRSMGQTQDQNFVNQVATEH